MKRITQSHLYRRLHNKNIYSSVIMPILIVLGFFILFSCVVPSEGKTKFKQDSFIYEETLRDKLAQNVEYDASIGYMSYAISAGEVVLRINYDLEETLKYIMDTEPLEKAKLKEAKYISKHIVDIHVRNQKYEFNDYETEVWLSGLLSALSYVIVNRNSPEDRGAVNVEKVGTIFIQTIYQYILFEPNQLIHIRNHPVFKEFEDLVENKASQETIDIFYASLFEVSADSLYLIPRDVEVEKIIEFLETGENINEEDNTTE